MVNKILSKIYELHLKFNKNVTTKGKLIINGRPIVIVTNGSTLNLGRNVKLNSSNEKYHINMHSAVKLYADRVGAKIVIKDNTRIHGTCLHAYQYIEVGSNCLIAANCQIFDGDGHDVYLEYPIKRINTSGGTNPVIIGDNCWIGANCIIMPGVQLGDNCVVSAGSIVRGSFNENSLIAGNPAKCIEKLK